MTPITVNENWKVEIDCHNNHQLVRFVKGGVVDRGKYKGNVTQDRWVEMESYHKNMASALRRISEIEVSEGNSNGFTISLQGYIDRLEALYKQYCGE